MRLGFEKWHGCRNDFLVIWTTRNESAYLIGSLSRRAPELCSRKGDGVAADGILVLLTETRGDTIPSELVVVNQDGTIAQNCGNGLRCAAASAWVRHENEGQAGSPLELLEVAIGERSFVCRFLGHSKSDTHWVSVGMGSAQVGAETSWSAALDKFVGAQISDGVIDREFSGYYGCRVGNDHVVVQVDKVVTPYLVDLGKRFGEFQEAGEGCNIHMAAAAEITDQDRRAAKQEIGASLGELYTAASWERGVGLTQACGSGAVAIAAGAMLDSVLDEDDWIGVQMPGGRLYIQRSSDSQEFTLTGPAQKVFEGELEI